jgi:hypothetical protein
MVSIEERISDLEWAFQAFVVLQMIKAGLVEYTKEEKQAMEITFVTNMERIRQRLCS